MAWGDTVEDWQNRLEEINDELGLMVGRPGFSVGGMSTDERDNYERLTMMKVEAEAKIEAFGSGSEATRNVRTMGSRSSW